MQKYWWKILAAALLYYTFIGGFLFDVPRLSILNETIRNQHFHVPMWFSMLIILTASVVYSIKYLSSSNSKYDIAAAELTNVGVLLGVLGICTGMIWARFTWGSWWLNDPKLNSAAIALLIYFAYLVLRASFEDDHQRARIGAIYNIFAYAAMVPLLFILPRLAEFSLHPGNGGNPGFNIYDLDSKLRLVFYPAVIGWTLMGVWLASLLIRLRLLKSKIDNN